MLLLINGVKIYLKHIVNNSKKALKANKRYVFTNKW